MTPEVATIGTRAAAVRSDVQILDVARLDARLMSLLDEPLVNWATRYHKDGLKKLLRKRMGSKRPVGPWAHLQHTTPTLDEIWAEFSTTDDADGIVAVLDETGLVVVDLDGDLDQAHRLLADAGVVIPELCPRVLTGSGGAHFWFKADRPVGRHIKLLLSRDADGDTTASVDVLGEGLVLLPPSVHPETGEPYTWRPPPYVPRLRPPFVLPAQFPQLPTRLYELIAESQRPTQPRVAPVDGPIPEGERERTLCTILGAARGCGRDESGRPSETLRPARHLVRSLSDRGPAIVQQPPGAMDRQAMEADLCNCSSCQRLAHEPMSLRVPRSIYHKRLDEMAARRRGKGNPRD